MSDILLGKNTIYPDKYDASLLYPIPRSVNRQQIISSDKLPFFGFDIWNAYEVSWLRADGCPQIAVLEIVYDCDSEYIVESKSLKLYLNSFNNTQFSDAGIILQIIERDLNDKLKTDVKLRFHNTDTDAQFMQIRGDCIDNDFNGNMLGNGLVTEDELMKDAKLYSHLLKSNCPVTNQPDWATVFINYTGKKINHGSLLNYIISLRNLNEFHEHCVEKIYMDILQHCQPEKLQVYARYTRRGGIDINPFRSSKAVDMPENNRIFRQ